MEKLSYSCACLGVIIMPHSLLAHFLVEVMDASLLAHLTSLLAHFLVEVMDASLLARSLPG